MITGLQDPDNISLFDFKDCRQATSALFIEHRNENIQPVFTKYPRDRIVDGELYMSIRKLFVDTMDPTEHTFVNRVFGGDWEHWDKVKHSLNNNILRSSSTDDWLAEMMLAIKSAAFKRIIQDAQDENSQTQIATCKWIVEDKWKPKAISSKQEEKRKKAEIETKNLLYSVDDDAKRVAHLFEIKG